MVTYICDSNEMICVCHFQRERQFNGSCNMRSSLTGWENTTQHTHCNARRSYVAKTTEQLKHALASMDATGVELRAVEVVGNGSEGSAAFDREVERVRAKVGMHPLSCFSAFK